MPYAPGIQDISGQLTAQGINQAAQAYAQKVGSISNAVTGFMQTYQQNQMMTSQAMGKFQGALRSDPALQKYIQDAASDDPNTPKLSPELQKAIDNAKAGKIDLYDAAVLGNFVDTWGSNRQRMAQTALQQAQADRLIQETDQAKKAQAYFESLMPGAEPQMQVAAPAQQMGQQPAVPASVPYYLARLGAPATAQPPTEAIQAMQRVAAQPAGMPTGRQAALQLYGETGKIPPSGAVNARLREMQKQFLRENQEQLMYPTFEEANAAARGAVQSGQFATGTIPVVKQDPATKRFFLETATTSYESPEVSSKRVGMESAAKERAASTNKFLEEISSNARAASADSYRVNKAISFLEQGVPTGPLTPEALKVKSLMLEAGLLDSKQAEAVKNGEELVALLNQGALAASQRYLKGGGSVSNEERARVDTAVENARKNPGTNLELLKTVRAAHMKDLAADAYRRNLRKQGLNDDQIRDRVDDWIYEEANSLDRFMGRVPSAQGVKELTVSSGKMGETKVVPQSGTPAAASGYVVGAKYTSKKDGKDYVWDGSKMVPVQ